MTTARQIIELALEGMNKLAPGEVMSADIGAMALRQLNMIADTMGAGRNDLFQDQLISGTVTGTTLTLGTGSFAAISSGHEIQGMTADGYRMSSITFEQYRDIFIKTTSGRPLYYCPDGGSNIYLWPAAAGNTMAIQCRVDISQFADLDTDYTFPQGYLVAFVTSLVVALAPSLLGGASAAMERAKTTAMTDIERGNIRPLILGGSRSALGGILNGFN